MTQIDTRMVGRGLCECCGKPNMLTNSTPEIGCYCKECLKLTIDNCKTAIKEIDEYSKTTRVQKVQTKRRITSEELDELKRKRDDALAKLFSGDFSKRNI